MGQIGLIAGNGQFPLLVAQAAKTRGWPVYVVAHVGETDTAVEGTADEVLWVKIGQLQRSMDFFKSRGVGRAVMAGGITKENMFVNFEPDERAYGLVAKLGNLNDDSFLRALADEYDAEGITIEPSTSLLPELLAPEGVLTARHPSPAELLDIEFGWRIAKELGRLDVGQCVVVRNLAVLALEAIDGSDETIRRGGRLGRENAVVVKVCKPAQDFRFDLPSVGLETIGVMSEVKASVLAVEAGRSLIFDFEEMIAAADRAGITIVARRGE